MILEERTLKEVLVYILAVYMQFLLKGVSVIVFANVALCGLGIHTHFALSHVKVYCPDVMVRIWNLFSVLVRDKVPVMIIAIFVMYGFCDEHHTTKI